MFSFARQKRTRKAPATFDAREARPGFHPGPQNGGRRDKIGRCAYGTDAFSDFAPTPIGKNAYRKQLQGGEKPSPSRLCRATSPERERLWQRRKVYRLSADFFLPLTNEDETCPLCQGLSLRKTSPGRGKMSPVGDKKGNSCRRRRLRGFVPKVPLSRQTTERVSPKTTLHTKMTRADTRAIQIFSAGAADLLSANHFPVSGCCSSQIHSRILSGRFVTMASGPKGSSERSTLRVSTVQNATLTPSA